MKSKRCYAAMQTLADAYGISIVLDWYEMPDFVEITARIGSDVSVYRVYDNGQITLKG